MTWRERKMREAIGPREGWLLTDLLLKARFWWAAARPKHYVQWRINRFKVATLQIGDVVFDPSRDVEWEVLEAKPGRPIDVLAYYGNARLLGVPPERTTLDRATLAWCRVK